MKLSVILVSFLSLSLSYGGSYAQEAMLSLNISNGNLKEVFKKIESQSEFSFMYDNTMINVEKEVSIRAKGNTIKEVLDKILDQTEIQYQIIDRHVVLLPVKEKQQERGITGKVTDENQSGLPGVNIIVKGTSQGTVTDVEGNYSLEIPNDNTILVFSSVGYVREEVTVGTRTVIDLSLVPDMTSLDEIVVVGYGTQKKVTLTGAVASIDSDDIITTKTQNVENALNGKIAGVRVVQNSSEPGDFSNQFDIRGLGSPLIVIDGVPRDNITRLDPNEIESVSVLKDASAAVYGVRAANGVVLVTTKRGKGRAKIEYSGFYGTQSPIGLPKPVGAIERFTLMNEKTMHSLTNPTLSYTDEDFAPYMDGSRQSTDWYDMVMNNNAPQYQHNLSASGSSQDEKIDYYFNLGSAFQQGYWKSGDLNYERYNLRSNINAQITNSIRASLKLNGILDERNSPYAASWTVYKALWRVQPNQEYYTNNNPEYLAKVGDHPGAMADADINGYHKNKSKWLQSQLELEYQIPGIKGLKAKGMFSYDATLDDNTDYQKAYKLYDYSVSTDSYTGYDNNTPDRLNRYYGSRTSTLLQFSLNYAHVFNEKHNVGALLLYEESTREADNFYARRELGIPLDYLFAGKEDNQIGNSDINGIWKNANKGLVGRFNYDYSGKYIAEVSFRYDGSSKFAPGQQWGFFPAASVGWRISEEDFFQNVVSSSIVSNLKLRASYGIMGDDRASSYQFISGYDYPYNGNPAFLAGNYMFGTSLVNSLGFRSSPNPYITWYESKTTNIGMDADFIDGKLDFSFDLFRRDREGLLANRLLSIPGSFGSTMPQENLNSDQTSGFELALGHRNNIGEVGYNLRGYLALTRTKRIYVERGESGSTYDNWRNNTSDRYNDIWFGYGYEGQYQSYEEIANSDVYAGRGSLPGDYIYEDWNNDGVIDGLDRHPIATTINPTAAHQNKQNYPLMTFGLTTMLDYKGFDLNLLFQGGAMSYVAYGEMLSQPLMWDGNALGTFMDRWHPVDPKADPYDPNNEWESGYWAYTGTNPDLNSRQSIQNGAYVRLKSAELGYSLPKGWFNKIGLQGVRLFANGYNLLTFSNVEGVDPEHPSEAYGYMYPLSRTINGGATITF